MVSWGYFIAGLTWITSISYSFAHWFPNIRSKSHGVFTIWMWIFFIISVGLFVWGSSFKSKTFHSYVDVTNGSEWLQRLTYTRHSWQLSNKDFSVIQSLWLGTFVYNGHLRGLVTHTYFRAFIDYQWDRYYLYMY